MLESVTHNLLDEDNLHCTVPQIEVHNILHCTVLTTQLALYCATKQIEVHNILHCIVLTTCTVLCLQIHKSQLNPDRLSHEAQVRSVTHVLLYEVKLKKQLALYCATNRSTQYIALYCAYNFKNLN